MRVELTCGLLQEPLFLVFEVILRATKTLLKHVIVL